MIIPLFIVGLSLIGLMASLFIFKGKRDPEHFYCPFGMRCSEVVMSGFGRLFGLPNELIGIFYYSILTVYFSLLSLAFLTSNFNGVIFLARFYQVIFVITGIAFLFSLYLVFIQIFKLKKYCFWCLVTAVCNASIFGLLVLRIFF